MVTTSIHMENVQDGIRKFYQRHGKLPETLAEVKGTLCTRMYDNTGWDKKTKDGWGRPFLYERTGDTTYRLRSLALESVLGTEKVKDIHVDADAATRTAAGSAAERSDAQIPD